VGRVIGIGLRRLDGAGSPCMPRRREQAWDVERTVISPTLISSTGSWAFATARVGPQRTVGAKQWPLACLTW
jgi:hypothetical protein